jgi:6-phosphogluconate dehydrogenase
MEIGMIGLGRMGGNMAHRLLQGGHRVVVWNRSQEPVAEAVEQGAEAASVIADFVPMLSAPRAVWMMLPAGDVTEFMLNELLDTLETGDIIIDGGNSNYRETIRRAGMVTARKLHYVDVGTSGGVWGLTEGYSLMIGGESEPVERLRTIFETLAPSAALGWGHVGPSGAGHFVKMVHNGIEYGMMQAMAEGFEIMKKKTDLELDVAQIAEVWRYGSVVRSWLLDLTAAALQQDPDLASVAPWVADSGEGRWTVQEAIDLDVPAPVITLALMARFVSRNEHNYSARVLAAMRKGFGGHAIRPVDVK